MVAPVTCHYTLPIPICQTVHMLFSTITHGAVKYTGTIFPIDLGLTIWRHWQHWFVMEPYPPPNTHYIAL